MKKNFVLICIQVIASIILTLDKKFVILNENNIIFIYYVLLISSLALLKIYLKNKIEESTEIKEKWNEKTNKKLIIILTLFALGIILGNGYYSNYNIVAYIMVSLMLIFGVIIGYYVNFYITNKKSS